MMLQNISDELCIGNFFICCDPDCTVFVTARITGCDVSLREVTNSGQNDSNAGTDPDPLDPYDNPLTMPLREFVVHPEVDDLLSNGAAMQVLLPMTNPCHS